MLTYGRGTAFRREALTQSGKNRLRGSEQSSRNVLPTPGSQKESEFGQIRFFGKSGATKFAVLSVYGKEIKQVDEQLETVHKDIRFWTMIRSL